MGIGGMLTSAVQSIRLINFQSHAQTDIEFAGAGRLTAIAGPTDSGKTAIVRALKWLMFNQPAGTGFIRAGTSSASMSVRLTTGQILTRIRSGSVNQYRISQACEGTYQSEDGEQVFEGFGTTVPLEVAQLLGVYPLYVGDLALLINLSEQLDAPFLGRSLPSTLRAKVLLRIAGSEVLDMAARTLSLDSHRGLRERERLEIELGAIKRDIAEHSWVDEATPMVERAERLFARIEQQVRTVDMAQALAEAVSNLPESTSLIKRTARAEQVFSRVESLVARVSEKHSRLRNLYPLVSDLRRATEDERIATEALVNARCRLDAVDQKYTDLVAQLEFCPTCGQPLIGGSLESGAESAD